MQQPRQTTDHAFDAIHTYHDRSEGRSAIGDSSIQAWQALTDRQYTEYLKHKAAVQQHLGLPVLALARTPMEHYFRLLREAHEAWSADHLERIRTQQELAAIIAEFPMIIIGGGDVSGVDFTKWPDELFGLFDFMSFESYQAKPLAPRELSTDAKSRLASGRWVLDDSGMLQAMRIIEHCSFLGIPYKRVTRGDIVITYFLGRQIRRHEFEYEETF